MRVLNIIGRSFNFPSIIDLCRPVIGLTSIPSLSISKLNMLEQAMLIWIDCKPSNSLPLSINITIYILGWWQVPSTKVAGSSLGISLSKKKKKKKNGGEVAYQSHLLALIPQNWDFCAIDMTFYIFVMCIYLSFLSSYTCLFWMCSEWAVNIQRDSYASYVGHYPILAYFAIAENESIGRERYNFMQVLSNSISCFVFSSW